MHLKASDCGVSDYDVILAGRRVKWVKEVNEEENWAVLEACGETRDFLAENHLYADNMAGAFPLLKVYGPFRLFKKKPLYMGADEGLKQAIECARKGGSLVECLRLLGGK